MNKLVNQLVNSFQLIKDEYFTDSFLPNTLCYPCTGYMLLILSDNKIKIAEDISYCYDSNNNPTIMFLGNMNYTIDVNSYNNIVNHINSLLIKHNDLVKKIKNNLVKQQLDSIKTDF